MNAYSNPCYRCGKERVISKTWKEKAENGSEVTVTLSICPDPACQKEISREMKSQKAKAKMILKRKEDRLAARKAMKRQATA